MATNKRRFLIRIIPLLLYLLFSQYEVEHKAWYRSWNNSRLARKRRKKTRILWSDVNTRISDVQFQRMFRMNRECFHALCQKIISCVGEKEFKSEAYIDAFLKGVDPMYDAHCISTGGYVSGEVKLAITLRLLAGGDALDLGILFDI